MKGRIAVIGAGIYGIHVLKVMKSASEAGDIDLVAVAETNVQKLEQAVAQFGVRGYSDYTVMLDKEELDAVAVVTPDYLHKEITLEAVSRKLHVLCQKPIATSSAEGREMVAAADKAGVMLYVDFHKRFDPAHRRLKKDIMQGKLGTILYGDVYMENRLEVPAVWFTNWAHNSSPSWFLGTHFYDMVSWLLDSQPVRVFAHGNKLKLRSLGIDTYDHVSAQVIYENGATITFNTSWVLPNNFPSPVNQQIRLVGTDGICEIDSQDRGMFTSYTGEASCQVINPFGVSDPDDPLGLPIGGYTCESILQFIRILNRLKNGASLVDFKGLYPSGREALTATAVCEAIHESIKRKTFIDLTDKPFCS